MARQHSIMDVDQLRAAAELLIRARRVVLSTGAGMSAESGVPTFRDASGMWARFNPEELATPMAFARDPHKVWDWYRARRAALAKCNPHDGHRILANWERRFPEFDVITQNVDGLHHRAGSTRVLELHGRLDVARCVACPRQIAGLEDLGPAPKCPDCDHWLRPGVVWFHESLPAEALEAAELAAAQCDVYVSVGTSSVVYPAAGLLETAYAAGASVIEINPTPTPCSGMAKVRLRNSARAALMELDQLFSRTSDGDA